MKRRDFMMATAAGGVTAAVAGMYARRASGEALFGDTPSANASSMLPAANQAKSILEIFMYGGVTPWESTYCIPSYGAPATPGGNGTWHQAYPNDFLNAVNACGYDTTKLFVPFAKDSKGRDIFLGPYLNPLIARTDVTDRMRVVVNRHTLEPHEAAIPMALAGKPLGSPFLASLGAHVAAYKVDHDDGSHKAPFAYGFSIASSFVPTDNVLTMVATGQHTGAARPVHIKVDAAARLNALLNRNKVGTLDDRGRYDQLLGTYFAQYQNRLHFGGKAEAPTLRAARLAELMAGASSVTNATIIQQMVAGNPAVGEDFLSPVPGTAGSPAGGYLCYAKGTGAQDGTGTAPPISTALFNNANLNSPYMSLRLATHLLTHPQYPAAHCCVIDTGLKEADGGGGYDTHNETPFTQAHNAGNLLGNLMLMINKPGEHNPNKIDLDKTMVILNMEFGRAPGLQKTYPNTGRNHWPYGYTQVYLGGPITNAQRGVYGNIGEDGQATVYTSPTENRIAALLAMGIYPFGQLAFSGSDVQGQTEEGPALRSVLSRVLGINV
jgi:hypothetical protein